MIDPASDLWVVTAYYNPMGYRRRLANFHAFRRHLAAPLLVAELSRAGRGDLADDDADVVLRFAGEDRLWQKERLINLAVAQLPPHVRHVAWIDADLILSDPHWPDRVRERLDARGGLLQVFDTAYHLPPELDPAAVDVAQCRALAPDLTGVSIARALREGRFDHLEHIWHNRARGDAEMPVAYVVRGFGWAARRAELARAGLYTGNVVGGGDWLMAFAQIGRLEQCFDQRPFTPAHRDHVRAWYEGAHKSGLFDHLGDVPQTAWHLWHGALTDRRYSERYHILVDHDYDPARDLVAAPGAVHAWADPAGPLPRAVEAYFRSRREDGAGS